MKFLQILLVLALATTNALAADPGPLQDFCVGINSIKGAPFVNGKFCKDPSLVTSDDFFFAGLRTPGNTSNQLGSNGTAAFVDQFLGLNTLGISIARIDYEPNGLNPPHIHPRATELLLVVEGTVLAGFVTTDELGNHLYSKVLYPGDLFVFPLGLVHFNFNIGKTKALAFASFNSQNPGVGTIANSIFGTNPPFSADVLAKAFQLDKKTVEHLQSLFSTNT